ncbi:hypothetical protein BE221DRAFT_76860, partial [Ostreococcus tauri]
SVENNLRRAQRRRYRGAKHRCEQHSVSIDHRARPAIAHGGLPEQIQALHEAALGVRSNSVPALEIPLAAHGAFALVVSRLVLQIPVHVRPRPDL